MNWQARSQWVLKWVLPAAASLIIGCVLFGTLQWAAGQTDMVAEARQRDLVKLIVSKMQASVAHDQESATVWDDAVRKTDARDLEWLRSNLGEWMQTYFGHDAAIVLSADHSPIYEFIAPSDNALTLGDLRLAYEPLADALQKRLAAGDAQGITDRVLSIGESDLAYVGRRPAIVSVKPIVSDTGDIEQPPGQQNLHVAVRFLDRSFVSEIGADYQFAEMKFSDDAPTDAEHSFVPLKSRAGAAIGYFTWRPFRPGANVMEATLPAVGLAAVAIFVAASLCGHAIWRRSTRLASNREELQHLASRDPLTGLSNRAHFSNELAARLGAASQNQSHCVLFIDLDRFKAVNDTFGHPTGDRVISLVGQRMNEIMPAALIGRIGGDEFTVFLEEADGEVATAVCQQIVQRLRQPFEIDGAHIVIGASVGAAVAAGRADPSELTRQADIALYHAKAAGRNTFAIFGGHMDELLRRRRKLEHDLRLALETRSQIEAFYQPVYSAEHKGLSSMEALARWKHPEEGFIAPDIFIPIAEEIGLIHELGAKVLEDACSVMADLPLISMAINASALELCSDGYPLRVLSRLAKWNIDPKRLEIEITESLAFGGEAHSDRNIAMLRNAGVRIAIDDFGTGYSSFSRVQNVMIDRIKIDKSFIDAVQGDSKPLIEAMINMARAKGLKTTAEGVETDEQSDALVALGCDSLQGFLISRPLARAAMIDLFNGTGKRTFTV
ncbi:putative bifunctional diguanylate cyclase/phosphodiesterase [Rhizobium hidalgonense]|uniref:Bifunctional diguanylate cyclase/phosphodiesterase n=1 Tax=Rhizobium hidalgonense TaxID=1538159 RepID=A0ABX4JQD6_9HYPH|nr:EAL domain-containing protein [Rhizobium hidalgonense]PDT22279.1 bifunctional diguanylate cyclase/phosphodiesterase [Rhizobium hidalgonense]PON08943.1 diguanylate cyclase [Rhizobium hidalgonense]